MNVNAKSFYLILFLSIFIVLPTILFIFVDIPSRTILKNILSIITILAFFIVLGQFFVSRINESIKTIFNASKLIKVHKILGYVVLPILLFHPILIVVPRFFEAGPDPFDSFIKMITTFDSLSIILGLIAWVLMLLLGLTAMLRNKLNIKYKSWKIFHGILSLIFIIFASYHAIETGRHMNLIMSIVVLFLTLFASLLLLKAYLFNKKKTETKGLV